MLRIPSLWVVGWLFTLSCSMRWYNGWFMMIKWLPKSANHRTLTRKFSVSSLTILLIPKKGGELKKNLSAHISQLITISLVDVRAELKWCKRIKEYPGSFDFTLRLRNISTYWVPSGSSEIPKLVQLALSFFVGGGINLRMCRMGG